MSTGGPNGYLHVASIDSYNMQITIVLLSNSGTPFDNPFSFLSTRTSNFELPDHYGTTLHFVTKCQSTRISTRASTILQHTNRQRWDRIHASKHFGRLFLLHDAPRDSLHLRRNICPDRQVPQCLQSKAKSQAVESHRKRSLETVRPAS